MVWDIVTTEQDIQSGDPLLIPVMRDGYRLAGAMLEQIRHQAANNLAKLPEPLRQFEESFSYRVEIALALRELAKQVDQDLLQQQLGNEEYKLQ